MDPATIAALITTGGGLLGSILKGFGKSEQEQALIQDQKNWEARRNRSISDVQRYMRPELARYNIEKDLPKIDPFFKKLLIGRMGETFGADRLSKFGIDLDDLLGGIGKNESPDSGTFGGRRIPGSVADRIMGKYGGHVGKRTHRATEEFNV